MSKGSKQPAATTQTTTTEFPSELKPYIKDILERAKSRAKAEEKAGYQAYTGPRIAGFEPEQLAAQQATKDIVGRGVSADPMLSSAQTYYAPALGLTLGQAERFGAPQAAQYMSPYQQAVIDVEKREAARSFAPQMQQIGAQAVGAGGFGGSRQAILEAEALRNQQQMLGDIQTRGTQQAYDRAQAAFEAQKARERGAAGSLAQMGAAIPGQAFKEIGALEAVGAGRRADTQRALDLGYSQFQEEQLFPTKTLQEYQSIVRGFPYTPNTYTSGFTTTPPASLAQNVLGIGTGIAGLAGAFGGFGAKEGGHLAKLAQAGKVADGEKASTLNAGLLGDIFEKLGLTSDAALVEEKQRQDAFQASKIEDAKPEYTFKEGEERTTFDASGKPRTFKYLDGKFYAVKEDGSIAKSPTSDLNLMIRNIKNVDKEGQAQSPIVATEDKPIVQTEPQDISTLVRDIIPGGAEPDDTKTVVSPSTVASVNAAKQAEKNQTSSNEFDVKDLPTVGGSSSNTSTNNTSVGSTDTNNTTAGDTTTKDGLEGISLKSLKEETRDILNQLKTQSSDVPEYKALTKAYEDRLKSIGKREEDKKADIKKQKYLQLAQFGLNVLSADTSKGDLQIIGEAGKKPLEAVGQLVSEEAQLADKSDVEKLAILGKQADIADKERTMGRQVRADQIAAIGAMTDIYEAEAKKAGISTTLPRESEMLTMVESLTGFNPKALVDNSTLVNEAIRDAQLEWLTTASSSDARNVQAVADILFREKLKEALRKKGLAAMTDRQAAGNTGGITNPRTGNTSAGSVSNNPAEQYMGSGG